MGGGGRGVFDKDSNYQHNIFFLIKEEEKKSIGIV